jgi:hypothetical protein
MVIYMEQYAAVRAAPAARLGNGKCGDEIMHANWNPALRNMSPETLHAAASPELPDDLSTMDVSAFLNRVYALATLI